MGGAGNRSGLCGQGAEHGAVAVVNPAFGTQRLTGRGQFIASGQHVNPGGASAAHGGQSLAGEQGQALGCDAVAGGQDFLSGAEITERALVGSALNIGSSHAEPGTPSIAGAGAAQ